MHFSNEIEKNIVERRFSMMHIFWGNGAKSEQEKELLRKLDKYQIRYLSKHWCTACQKRLNVAGCGSVYSDKVCSDDLRCAKIKDALSHYHPKEHLRKSYAINKAIDFIKKTYELDYSCLLGRRKESNSKKAIDCIELTFLTILGNEGDARHFSIFYVYLYDKYNRLKISDTSVPFLLELTYLYAALWLRSNVAKKAILSHLEQYDYFDTKDVSDEYRIGFLRSVAKSILNNDTSGLDTSCLNGVIGFMELHVAGCLVDMIKNKVTEKTDTLQ